MDILFLKAVLKGVLLGMAVIALLSLVTALALTAVSDPLAMTSACGMIADFGGGIAAAVFAVATKKQKPLPTALSAGLVLCLVLFLVALVCGNTAGIWLPLGAVLCGSLIGALVPAASHKSTSRRKLKPYMR